MSYKQLLALPAVEHIDIRSATLSDEQEARGTPAPPSLRCLLLPQNGMFPVAPQDAHVDGFLTPLVPIALQHVTVTTQRMRTLAALQSLTSLDLHSHVFGEQSALQCLMSATGESLLPSPRCFASIIHGVARVSRAVRRGDANMTARRCLHVFLQPTTAAHQAGLRWECQSLADSRAVCHRTHHAIIYQGHHCAGPS